MKKLLALLAAFVLTAGVVFAASPCEGYWINKDDETKTVWQCWKVTENADGTLSIMMTLNPAEKPDATAYGAKGKSYADFQNGKDLGDVVMIGTTWFWGFQKKAEGKYVKGILVNPSDGGRYTMNMELKDGILVLTPIIAGIPASFAAQKWAKCSEAVATGKEAYYK